MRQLRAIALSRYTRVTAGCAYGPDIKAQQPSGAQAGLVGRMAEALRAGIESHSGPERRKHHDDSVSFCEACECDLCFDAKQLLREYDASPLPGDGGDEPVAWLMYSDNIARADRLDVCRLEPKNRHGHRHAFPVYTNPSPLPASERTRCNDCHETTGNIAVCQRCAQLRCESVYAAAKHDSTEPPPQQPVAARVTITDMKW